MKTLILLALITGSIFISCQKNDCIDKSKVEKYPICTEDINFVCGCDGITYTNACHAEKSGVMYYTQGECGSKP